jgi:hypothetical protein
MGGLLLVLTVPRLTDEQQGLSLAVLLSVVVNLLLVGALAVFLRHEQIEERIRRTEKLVALQLPQDEEVKKAIELIENPLANRRRPRDADILSTEDSESKLKDIPKDMMDGRSIGPGIETPGIKKEESTTRTSESPVEEDRFTTNQPVFPFLKNPTGKSVKELITGSTEEVPRTLAGPTYELNTYRWDFAPYMLKWKNKMTDKWYRITSRIAFNPFAKLGQLLVWVKMNRQGQLLDSRVIEYTCDKSFVAPAYASVVNSFPLDPLPESFPEDMLETTWTITITD